MNSVSPIEDSSKDMALMDTGLSDTGLSLGGSGVSSGIARRSCSIDGGFGPWRCT